MLDLTHFNGFASGSLQFICGVSHRVEFGMLDLTHFNGFASGNPQFICGRSLKLT
ncbi:hypothetical protein ACQ4M4_26000 [Leptolyngbya sp. AN02str]|uniref:hypothetical protein n=1 Tax=Leptolyngbya sp. AN02str TaxID=3423363 RepID=UPI003D31E14A